MNKFGARHGKADQVTVAEHCCGAPKIADWHSVSDSDSEPDGSAFDDGYCNIIWSSFHQSGENSGNHAHGLVCDALECCGVDDEAKATNGY